MKILRVGDPHIKPSNIDESDKLMDFVNDVALERKVDRIELLGDLFHTHSILHLPVIEFWDAWLDTLSEAQELVVLVGNHDQSGNSNSDSNALRVFQRIKKKNLRIVEHAQVLGNIGYVPYVHDNERFVELANGLIGYGAKSLVSHTTYSGSKYESGIFAPDGVDPDLLSKDFVHLISGHIHSRQRFGRVIYPGTAKWDSASDANEEKGLWLVEHDDATSAIIKEEFISTDKVCTPILSLQWKEGDSEPAFPENAKVAIELIGSSDWVSKQKGKLKGQVSIKTKITDKAKAENRKTGTNFEEFIKKHYVAGSSVDKDKLLQYMKGLNLVE